MSVYTEENWEDGQLIERVVVDESDKTYTRTDGEGTILESRTADAVELDLAAAQGNERNRSTVETSLRADLDAMQAIADTPNVSFATVAQAQSAVRDLQRQVKDIARNLRRLDRAVLDDYTGTD